MSKLKHVGRSDYLFDYQRDISPHWMASLNGLVGDGVDYLELGMGQGLSLAIHAATNAGGFVGLDNVEAHCRNAAALGEGLPIDVLCENFAEFLDAHQERMFDVITLHGVWSWVAEAQRREIEEIVSRHLRPGGLFYVSFLTPHALSSAAVREVMQRLYEKADGREDVAADYSAVETIADALGRMDDAGARGLKAGSFVEHVVESVRTNDPRLTLNDQLGSEWHPMSSATMLERMGAIGLDYAGSTVPRSNFDHCLYNEAAVALMDETGDAGLGQSLRDLFLERNMRRDVFVKSGGRTARLKPATNPRFAALVSIASAESRDAFDLGRIRIKKPLIMKVMEALAHDDYAPKTPAELMARTAESGTAIEYALTYLVDEGMAAYAREDAEAAASAPHAGTLNAALLTARYDGAGLEALAAPLVGIGLPFPDGWRAAQRAIAAGERGAEEPEGLARERPVLTRLGVL